MLERVRKKAKREEQIERRRRRRGKAGDRRGERKPSRGGLVRETDQTRTQAFHTRILYI